MQTPSIKKTIAAIVIATFVSSSIWADHHEGEANKPTDQAAKTQSTKERFDTNKDGKLDKEEKAAMKATLDAEKAQKRAEAEAKTKEKLLKRYDKNKNGQIDPDEQAAIDADKQKAKEKRMKKKAEGQATPAAP